MQQALGLDVVLFCLLALDAHHADDVGPVLEHKNTVFGAAFSPDGRMLATGSTDNTVRLWSVPGGEPLARPLDLHRPVRLVAFAPNGQSLATQDGDLVRLWALPREGMPTTRLPLDSEFIRLPQPRRCTHDLDRPELRGAEQAPEYEGRARRLPADGGWPSDRGA